eukprot:scaffold4850_cov340-Prasinococcus_capsulatus_cf.AAC.9
MRRHTQGTATTRPPHRPRDGATAGQPCSSALQARAARHPVRARRRTWALRVPIRAGRGARPSRARRGPAQDSNGESVSLGGSGAGGAAGDAARGRGKARRGEARRGASRPAADEKDGARAAAAAAAGSCSHLGGCARTPLLPHHRRGASHRTARGCPSCVRFGRCIDAPRAALSALTGLRARRAPAASRSWRASNSWHTSSRTACRWINSRKRTTPRGR